MLVYLETDAMTGAMDEIATETAVGDDLTGGRIDILTRDPRSDRGPSCVVGGLHQCMNLSLSWRGLANYHGAGCVRVIAADPASEVAHHHVAFPDDPVTRLMMRGCSVRAGGDDGGPCHVVPLGHRHLGEVTGDLAFCAP